MLLPSAKDLLDFNGRDKDFGLLYQSLKIGCHLVPSLDGIISNIVLHNILVE